MKVSLLVAAVLLVSACSREPDAGPPSAKTDESPAAMGTAGTAGSEPAVSRPTPPPEREAAPNPSPVPGAGPARDARAAAASPVTQEATRAGKNVPAAVLDDFKKRVEDYMDIRKRAAKDAPPLKETEDPARIKAAQEARAVATRKLRADAKAGDIFTPEIRHTFRLLLAPELRGEEGRDAKKLLQDDAPAPGAVPLTVNGKYPEGAPLPTVPASLLMHLPELPTGLDYRIIGKDLVLLDSDANLIVDFIRNAIR